MAVSRAFAADVGTCVYREHGPSTAFVEYSFVDQSGTPDKVNGSAFLISNNGYLLTAAHVLRPQEPGVRATHESVLVHFGKLSARGIKATIVKVDKVKDLALLKVDMPSDTLIPVPLGDSSKVGVTDRLTALGFPGADLSLIPVGQITANSAVFHGETLPYYWQTSLALNPGDSGGPVFNAAGTSVGVAAAIQTNAVLLNYVIPLEYAHDLLIKANVNLVARGTCGSFLSNDDAPIAGQGVPAGTDGYVYYEEHNGELTPDGVFGPPDGSVAVSYSTLKPAAILRSVKTARMRKEASGTAMLVGNVPAGACVQILDPPANPVPVSNATSGGRIRVAVLSRCP